MRKKKMKPGKFEEKELKLKDAKIRDEAELESILVDNPDQIEENFLVLEHQRKAHGLKTMDILGVDSENTLTVVELKVAANVNQLRQAIQYYDWILQQGIDWISGAYKEKLKGRGIEEEMPQIFLIAPEFADETLLEAKYLRENITIRFFRYLALEINNKKYIKLIEVEVPQIKEIETKPWTKNDNIDYIEDKKVRKLFLDLIKDIGRLDPQTSEKPAKRRIGYWVGGIKFCTLYPKKKHFQVGFKTGEEDQGWDKINNITSSKMYKNAFARIKNAYELMKEG